MKKKLAVAGMIVFLMLGLSGCTNRHEKNNEEMLAHMKEKYGVEFEIQNYIPRNVDCSYDVWFCNAVEDDPEQDRIEVHRYYGDLAKDGEYADEYYSRLVRDEVESRATEVLLQVVNEAKVYLSEYSFAGEEYTEADQLDEYLQTEDGENAFGMIIYIIDREEEGIRNQDTINQMEQIIPEAGIGDAWMRIVFVKNESIFDKLTRENEREMLYQNGENSIYTCNYGGAASIGFEP